jgi:hypothetical protein
VSQVPARSETGSISTQIAQLSKDLTLPAARDYQTRLRVLSVRGMLEVNYDAAMTSATYSAIETMALQRGHFLRAARARGEQGIADFLTGNIATAKKKVIYAWTVSKLFHDRAAQIRYASMYAEGLAQIGRYQEAQRAVGFCCVFGFGSTRCSAGDDGATGTCDRRGNNGSSSATNSVCDTIGIGGMCWARSRLRSAQTASADSPTRPRSTNSRAIALIMSSSLSSE